LRDLSNPPRDEAPRPPNGSGDLLPGEIESRILVQETEDVCCEPTDSNPPWEGDVEASRLVSGAANCVVLLFVFEYLNDFDEINELVLEEEVVVIVEEEVAVCEVAPLTKVGDGEDESR